jgi:hypothetical protein
MLTGEALQDLQDELEYVKEELAQFQCPDCGAPLSARNEVELDAELGVSGTLERFECGYAHVDGSLEHPCPNDPLFPSFEDYELVTRESNGQWTCYAQPKTKMARYVSIVRGVAWSEQEARDQVRKWYETAARKWKP